MSLLCCRINKQVVECVVLVASLLQRKEEVYSRLTRSLVAWGKCGYKREARKGRGKTERRSAQSRQFYVCRSGQQRLPADANLLIYDDKLIGETRQDSESPRSEMKIRNLRSGLQSTVVPIKKRTTLRWRRGFCLRPIGLVLPRAVSALDSCSTNPRLGQHVIHGICRHCYITLLCIECVEMLGIAGF